MACDIPLQARLPPSVAATLGRGEDQADGPWSCGLHLAGTECGPFLALATDEHACFLKCGVTPAAVLQRGDRARHSDVHGTVAPLDDQELKEYSLLASLEISAER